jgi:hypothetical protein
VERNRFVEPAPGQPADNAIAKPAGTAHANRSVHHLRDVDPQARRFRADEKRVAGVLDPEGSLERTHEPCIEDGARPGGAHSAHVDSGDADAAGDHVGVAVVPEVGVGAARRHGDPGKGQRDACEDQEATAHSGVVPGVRPPCK